jgi:hypothetical protein
MDLQNPGEYSMVADLIYTSTVLYLHVYCRGLPVVCKSIMVRFYLSGRVQYGSWSYLYKYCIYMYTVAAYL